MKTIILYASLTGNTLECAEILAQALDAKQFDVTVREITQLSAADLNNFDLCILGSYTYGVGLEGGLPDEVLDFYDELASVNLAGKSYAVFGSGDDYYPDYCLAVRLLDERLKECGAHKVAENVCVNLNPEEEDIAAFYQMSDQIATNLLSE